MFNRRSPTKRSASMKFTPQPHRRKTNRNNRKTFLCFGIQLTFFLVMASSSLKVMGTGKMQDDLTEEISTMDIDASTSKDSESPESFPTTSSNLDEKKDEKKEFKSLDPTSLAENGGTEKGQSAPIITVKKNDMESVLKQRFADLPPAPWPQLDHRIPEAILNGDMIGFDASMPPSSFQESNTIVTAYYEFESKHSVRQYEMWYQRILRTSEPMIIFVEPGSKWYTFTKENRSHAPTIVAQIPFDNLVMSTTFTKPFWDFMHSIDLEAKIHKGDSVYKIWNEKLIFMYSAIYLNPFNTPGFAWMDAGYFRNDGDAPKASTPIIKVNITEAGVPDEKLLVMHVRNDGLDAPGRVNIAGNSFVGTGRAFLEFYPKYYHTFWHWISIEKFIGSDQFVMTETCRRYKTHCHPFFPGSFRNWFAMSYAMAGKKDFSKVSPKYLFLDKPPSDVPEVPDGKMVSYCDGKIVANVADKLICR